MTIDWTITMSVFMALLMFGIFNMVLGLMVKE